MLFSVIIPTDMIQRIRVGEETKSSNRIKSACMTYGAHR